MGEKNINKEHLSFSVFLLAFFKPSMFAIKVGFPFNNFSNMLSPNPSSYTCAFIHKSLNHIHENEIIDEWVGVLRYPQ